ncbi:MAG: DUF87 domain-containing protein [Hyphomicrobiaceae bacterium]|nr:DUF87 domain-containing protein [Hyphomicrobiaceae bacterium]
MLSTFVAPPPAPRPEQAMGRVIAVNGARCTVLLDGATSAGPAPASRARIGSLLTIEGSGGTVLATVCGLNVTHPSRRQAAEELWIAELGLVGEIRGTPGAGQRFLRGVSNYPSLGDSVRTAAKSELELAYLGSEEHAVRIGTVLQEEQAIPARISIDDMLAKHFAILGTTGTGKSCTTTLLLRSILNENPEAHILLLDPHNEYASAFRDQAEVINQRNMQLPYWLLTFEELVEVVIGSADRREEIDILQELIPVAKNRFGRSPSQQGLRRLGPETKSTLDTPVPYRMSEVIGMLDERMGKLENKRDIAHLRSLKTRLESIIRDPRYGFMFGSLTVYDGMAQILGRLFRVPTRGRPMTIVELTGLPAEITTVVVSVLCRLTFDFALWCEGKVPVTLVCEEAHRYVPANGQLAFEPCRRAIARIAKEGRKYGASLCVITQRPAEIDPTILSQCSTVFALRLSNDRDQEIVRSALSDTGAGLIELLPTLGPREAIAFGDGVCMPSRVTFDSLPPDQLPRSASARYSALWKSAQADESFLETLVERWRNASSTASDSVRDVGAFADALGVPQFEEAQPRPPSRVEERMARSREGGVERREFGALRRDPGLPPAGAPRGGALQPGLAPGSRSGYPDRSEP